MVNNKSELFLTSPLRTRVMCGLVSSSEEVYRKAGKRRLGDGTGLKQSLLRDPGLYHSLYFL